MQGNPTPPHYMLLLIGAHRSDAKRAAFVKLDPEDYEWAKQYRWIIHDGTHTLYAKRAIYKPGDSNTRVRMHRELLGLPPGKVPEVDHLNGDGLDNRRANLRVATSTQNGQNRTGPNVGSSQFRGVGWDKDLGAWRAYGWLNRRKQHLGVFSSEAEAGEAAAAWRREHMPYSEMDKHPGLGWCCAALHPSLRDPGGGVR